MSDESRVQQWMNSASDWLTDQQWYQELKGKWDELDAKSQFYLKAASAGGGALLVLVIVISSMLSVRALRTEMNEKMDLLTKIQTANDELRRLRDTNSSAMTGASDTGPWTAYFESMGATSGLDKTNLNVSGEKPSPEKSETVKESLYDLSLKHVSIRNVVRYIFQLETGSRPVKLRNLMIDTKADPTGYLDATLSVSAFTLVNKP